MAKTVVVAFAFGVPSTIRSNRRIASIAFGKALELNAPIYTQRDITFGQLLALRERPRVIYTKEGREPPPTLRIAKEAVKWVMQEFFGEEIDFWVAAAKPHLWRCVRDLERAIGETKSLPARVRVCEEIEQVPEDEWFDPNGTQPRAASRETWNKRERILKAHTLLRLQARCEVSQPPRLIVRCRRLFYLL